MFLLGIPLVLAGAAAMALLLPLSNPTASMGYGSLLLSAGPMARRAQTAPCCTVQGLLFAAFSAFWTVLALHLEQPSFRLGADAAGFFGVVGMVGILTAPTAGKLADRRGAGPVILTGAFAALLAWLVLAGFNSLSGLVLGVVLLDFGVQSALVAHQQVIYGLRPQARNRVNILFMVEMFLCGSLGSGGAMLAWKTAAWQGVSAFAISMTLIASFGLLLLRKHQ